MENKTLGQVLECKSYGVFVNDKGEYCTVSSYYIRNNKRIQVTFTKGIGTVATRPAITTTSEKKVLKLLTSENFVLEKQ
jgi:hypothetical protein